MSSALQADHPELRDGLYHLYRDFLRKAERKRRWSLDDDIPWADANKNLSPAIANVIESFCAVELYLPDYISKALPLIRTNRGWAWFHANWGYEESKHSLALSDWLIRSGSRTEEQMSDLEVRVFAHDWNLPHDSAVGMLVYAMVQELATFLHYRNLRFHVDDQGDPALSRLLGLIAVDERAHHAFYARVVQMFLRMDRRETIDQLRRVLLTFAMPATHLLADSQQRMIEVKELGIFNEDIFYREVFIPVLNTLDIRPGEMRRPLASRKS